VSRRVIVAPRDIWNMLLAAIVRKLPLQIYALGYNARPASGTPYKYTRLCAYCARPPLLFL